MLHPVDTFTNPIYSKHPAFRIFKKLYRHKNRYAIKDEITLVCFYHIVCGKKQYHDIDYYIRRCQDRTISAKDISFEYATIVVTEKFICSFGVDGYGATLLSKDSEELKFINKVPELSIYHENFPRVYYEWVREIESVKDFVDYHYVIEIAKISSSRFREVVTRVKAYKSVYARSSKGSDVSRQN